MNKFCSQLKEKIEDSDIINIYPHVNADGDCIGSAYVFKYLLESLNKKVRLIFEDGYPDTYDFFCKKEDIILYEENAVYNADMHIAVDTGDLERLGKRVKLFKGPNTFNIDHHKTNTRFANYNFVIDDSSSCGEVLYDVLTNMGYEITKDIAKSMYIAIVTDTGGFRYTNTSAKCFQICSELIKTKIDIGTISKNVFDTVSLTKLKLTGLAIDQLKFYSNGKIGLVSFEKNVYEKIDVKNEMFDGIVNIPRNVKGVLVAAIIREDRDNNIKVSLRSNNEMYDMSKIALLKNGGGHAMASGYTVANSDLVTEEKALVELLKECINNGI